MGWRMVAVRWPSSPWQFESTTLRSRRFSRGSCFANSHWASLASSKNAESVALVAGTVLVRKSAGENDEQAPFSARAITQSLTTGPRTRLLWPDRGSSVSAKAERAYLRGSP